MYRDFRNPNYSNPHQILPPVTVITVSRRPELIVRCVESVRHQDYEGPLSQLVLADGDRGVKGAILDSGLKGVDCETVARSAHDVDGPTRLGHLRNEAVRQASGDFVVFLDDDNEWEPNHLSSLVACLREGWDVAHSHRQLYCADGSPYLIEEFPWGRDARTRKAIYAYCVEMGVMTRGSHVMRDFLEMRFSWVDLGEWILPRELLLQEPFETSFGLWDWHQIDVEDRGLGRAIFESGLSATSTDLPTLRYYLGGYTNNDQTTGVRWMAPVGDR